VPEEELELQGGYEKWPWKNPANDAPLVPTFPMLACNPDTELHWLYRRFHPDSPEHWERKFTREDGTKYSYHDLGYKMWMMDSRENKFLPKQNIELLMTKDESFVRRFVRGEWGIPEGQIHYIPGESFIDGSYDLLESLRQRCVLYRVLDHGDASPTCVLWFAVDEAGNVFCYREYYKPNLLISQHRKNIYEYSKYAINDPSVDYIEKYKGELADPSIFLKNQQRKDGFHSVADEYGDCKGQPRRTAIFWQRGDNDELGTRNRINEYLRVDPDRVHPITGERGAPRLYFMKRNENYPRGCYHVIQETRAQRRVKIGSDLGKPIFCDDRDEDIPDHSYDCLRYMIAERAPVAPKEKEVRNPRSFDEIAARHDRFMRRGGFKMQLRHARRRAALAGM